MLTEGDYAKGYFVAPTIIDDLPLDHELWQVEMFLPLVAVAAVPSLEVAMREANNSAYGLTGGFFSEDKAEVQWYLDHIEAGVVYTNRAGGATTGAWPGYQTFGGWKGSGSTGKNGGGPYYVQQYMHEQSQTVIEDYWRELRAICDRYGVLLIADEVMTGFGRTGEWFAWQHWADAAPDMMLLAKGLTAAHLPLGAVVLNERAATFFDDHPLPTGLTYAGHPLCCAAGVAAVETYEREGLVQRSRELGEWMHGCLAEIAARHPSVGDVRGMGLFGALELVTDRQTRQPLAPWPKIAPALKRLFNEAKARGVLYGERGNLIILAPPLIIDQNDLDMGLRLLDELLAITDAESNL